MSVLGTDGEPRTIIVPVDSQQTASYKLPPGLLQYVQSVLINVDNTAGPSSRPTLRISEQSGVVIAAKRQGEAIPAGETGTATWALRLTDEGVGTTDGVELGAAALFILREDTVLPSGVLVFVPFRVLFNTIGADLSPDFLDITTPGIGEHPTFGLALEIGIEDPPSPPTVPFSVLLYGGGENHSTNVAIEAVLHQGYHYGNNGYESDGGVVLNVQVYQDSGVDLTLTRVDYWIVYHGQAE